MVAWKCKGSIRKLTSGLRQGSQCKKGSVATNASSLLLPAGECIKHTPITRLSSYHTCPEVPPCKPSVTVRPTGASDWYLTNFPSLRTSSYHQPSEVFSSKPSVTTDAYLIIAMPRQRPASQHEGQARIHSLAQHVLDLCRRGTCTGRRPVTAIKHGGTRGRRLTGGGRGAFLWA